MAHGQSAQLRRPDPINHCRRHPMPRLLENASPRSADDRARGLNTAADFPIDLPRPGRAKLAFRSVAFFARNGAVFPRLAGMPCPERADTGPVDPFDWPSGPCRIDCVSVGVPREILSPLCRPRYLMIAFLTPGPMQLLILLVVVLLLFGTRLPSVARSLGRSIVEFKKGVKEIEDHSDEELSKEGSNQTR